MSRLFAAVALLALCGCHRQQGSIAPDATGEAQAQTSAKALADIAAADAAARAPMPREAAAPADLPAAVSRPERDPVAEAPAGEQGEIADDAGNTN